MANTTDLQTLVVSLEARLDKYTKAMNKASADTDRVTTRIAGQFSKLERQISGFGRTLIAGIGGVAVLRQFGEAIDRLANIGEIAERIGITTRALQAMHEMAKKTGASVEQVDRALQSIAEQSAQKGSFLEKLFQANQLKISTTDQEANIRSVMELLKNARSEADRLFILTSLVGDKVGRPLVEAFSQGSEAINKTAETMKAFTDDQIKQAHDIRQEFYDVSSDIQATWASMALTMIKAMQKVGDAVAPAILQFLGEGPPPIQTPTRRGQPLTPDDYNRLNAIRQGAKAGAGPYPFSDIIGAAAAKYNLDPAILASLIQHESHFDPLAKNPTSSAAGLTQLLSGTQRDLGVTNPYDPTQSVMGGAQYLRQMLDRFGNINSALAHYYQGPNSGAVTTAGNAYATAIQFNAARYGYGGFVGDTPGANIGTNAAAPGVAGGTVIPNEEDLKRLTEQLDLAREATKGFFGDLITGLRESKSLTDTLATAFDNLASKLIDQALNQLVALLLGQSGQSTGGLLGGLFGFGNMPARQGGGPVTAGNAYMVGERGRELFVPNVSGQIVPQSAGGGYAIHVTPSKYFDVHVQRISSAGDTRALDSARRAFPGTAARFQKLGTT